MLFQETPSIRFLFTCWGILQNNNIQSSEFNRRCIACKGLVLNRIVCDRRIWSLGCLASVSMTAGDNFVRRAKTSTVTPIFSFLISKRNVSERFWRFLKKNLVAVFCCNGFSELWCSEPLDLQLKHIQMPTKKTSVSTSVSEKTNTVTPNFFSYLAHDSHETIAKDRYWKNQPFSR